jgi:uncharacterized membrane protein
MTRLLHFGAMTALLGLIVLTLAWEAWLAPTGRGLLMVKALPLLLPLFGILRGKRYTHQWAPMLILMYFTEGVVRAWSDAGIGAMLAVVEIVLSSVFFVCAMLYARVTAPSRAL